MELCKPHLFYFFCANFCNLAQETEIAAMKVVFMEGRRKACILPSAGENHFIAKINKKKRPE